MSDMNLPTVTVKAYDHGLVMTSYMSEVCEPTRTTLPEGTYALVPVDAMEEVWWCRVQDTMWPKSEEGRCHHDEEGECVTAYRWLVSAKEEE